MRVKIPRLGCVYPHRWTAWYPGERASDPEWTYIWILQKRCIRCGKVKNKTGHHNWVCMNDNETEQARLKADPPLSVLDLRARVVAAHHGWLRGQQTETT